VEVIHAGEGELACCGKPMELQKPGTVDAALEKHVPYITKIDGGYHVQIGSVEHPMEEKHYIEWIEFVCLECDKVIRKYLKPGDKPVADFMTKSTKFLVREYCNIHRLWQSDKLAK